MSKKIDVSGFIREVREETRKITWPTRQATLSAAILIVVVSILAAIFFFVVDQSIMGIIRMIFGWFE